MTLAVMFAAQFLSGMGFSFVLPFFPFYFRVLGVHDESGILLWMGWSSAAFGAAMAVSAPLWGMAADRYGRKLMVVRSMFAGAVILGLMGLARNPWHLLVLRITQGLFTGTVSASITLVSSVTPSAHLGMSLGILQTAFLLGSSAGPLLGGIISDHFGFRIPCGIASAMLFIGVVFVTVFASETFNNNGNDRHINLRTMHGIIRTRGFKLLLVTYFLVYVLNFMVIPVLPLFIEVLSGYAPNAVTLTGVIVSVTSFLAGLSASAFGRLGDRLGPARVLVLSLVGVGLFAIPQSLAPTLPVFFIERCLMGIAIGGVLPSVHTLVSNTIPRDCVGGAYGLTASVTCLGIGAGPLIGGYLASIMGLRVPFAVTGFLALGFAFLLNGAFAGKTPRAKSHTS